MSAAAGTRKNGLTGMKQTGTIMVPNFIDEVSRIVGDLRNNTNRSLMEINPSYKRGEKTDDVNPLGIRGELIAQCLLSASGRTYQSAALLSDAPISEPDIVINGVGIDVKGVGPHGQHLLVNKKAHDNKSKNVDYYLFIQQLGNSARYWFYSYQDVSTWKVKFFKYTEAYCLFIAKADRNDEQERRNQA